MDAAPTPSGAPGPSASPPLPAGFLRQGVDVFDTVAVPLPCGLTVHIRPARCSAKDYLAGRASAYAVTALRARDLWYQAGRTGERPKGIDLAAVVLEAMQDTYDAPAETVEQWLAGADAAAIHAIAAAAIGATATPAARERGRARALVAGGLGDAPLAPLEAASLADWAVNAGRAPAWG